MKRLKRKLRKRKKLIWGKCEELAQVLRIENKEDVEEKTEEEEKDVT
jgi:hypothetical protein